jgi:hypothetical protein
VPWLKAGDNAATHPIVMRAGGVGDDRTVNEAFGFVMRCALQAAAHLTDYFIEDSVAWMFGGRHTERLLEVAQKVGYIEPATRDGFTGWMLVDDPDFIHMRLRAEVEWEKQQRADAANPGITVPARRRDGDECRYCGVIVQWRARKGGRRGTYDHREPGRAAKIETLVVACGACNAGRRDYSDADERYPLRPIPERPYYTAHTAQFLTDHGVPTQPTEGPQPTPVPRDPATSRTPRQKYAFRPPAESASAEAPETPAGNAGAGRDGAGSARAGSGSGAGQVRTPQGQRRSRRARRGRPATGQQPTQRTGQQPRPRETPPS